LTATEPVFSILARHRDRLRYLFIVSAVTLEKGAAGNGTGGISVQVRKADGKKCERCWNYSIHVGEDSEYPTVCERCSAVLKEIGG
jgi:isoleucyl-tRNA synthetase